MLLLFCMANYVERRELLDFWKAQPCADCKGTFPTICMDFDHRPNTEKLFELGSGWARSLDILIHERNKCDVVCSNCHRVRTASRIVHVPITRAQRAYWKTRLWVDEIRNVPCTDCAKLYPVCCMDFDHRENKTFSIMRNLRRARSVVAAEISKCDVVCSNCHRIRTHA